MSYNPAPIQSGTFDLRIRRTRGVDGNKQPIDNFKLYFGTDAIVTNTPQFDITMAGSLSPGNFVRIGTTYNSDAMFASATVKPTSLVTDRLVLSNALIGKDGSFSANALYYLPTDDALTFEVQSQSGDVIVPAAPYVVLENAAPGQAKLRAPANVPAVRKGSRVQVISRALTSAGVIDVLEMTFPNEAIFGQNVASMFNPNRARRVFSNMLVQAYWQDTFTTPRVDAQGRPLDEYDRLTSESGLPQANDYRTHKRSVPGTVDDLGNPLRGDQMGWYPLPDKQNEEVTLQLKYTGAGETFNIAHNMDYLTPAQGVKSVGAMTRIDAQTFEWKITVDRSTGVGLERCGNFKITSLDPNNPPKNLTLCVKGRDDLSQRFCQSFINKLKLIRGRLRFMDDLIVNGAMYFRGTVFDFSKRAKQTGIAGSLAIEDMIELANRSGRPLFYNIMAPFFYEQGGIDYFDRTLDMLYKGIGAEFQSVGFSAPNGVIKHIAFEVGNENWNYGFGGNGHYYYLIYWGNKLGRNNPDIGNGGENATAVCRMRNYAQTLIMSHIENRFPNEWRERTVRLFGSRMDTGDMANQVGNADGWATAKLHIDEILRAPYIPNDPNAGGQAAAFTDKSPQGIYDFLVVAAAEQGVTLAALAKQTIDLGYAHGIYEVQVAMISLGLTLAQNQAWANSTLNKKLWKEHIVPMLAQQGGYMDLYSDCTNIYGPGVEQWGTEKIPGHPTANGDMDAVEEFEALAMAP